MTNQEIFNNALKYADLETIGAILLAHNTGFTPREVAIEDILLNLGVIDKPVSIKLNEYEERAQEVVENQINQALEDNKS